MPSKDVPKHQNITKTNCFSMFFNASNSVPEAPPERFWAPWGRPFASREGLCPPTPGTPRRSQGLPRTSSKSPKELL